MNDSSPSIPQTSATLLLQLGRDAQHARWTEFVARYRPMMERYLATRFPAVDADEVVQETFIALVAILPNYRYAPEETGHFRSYLTGILRRKALRLLSREARLAQRHAAAAADGAAAVPASSDDPPEADWKRAVFELALRELLADDALAPRTREVFRALVLAHEAPAAVAARFGLARNAVDQIKNRLLAKLRTKVEQLKNAV